MKITNLVDVAQLANLALAGLSQIGQVLRRQEDRDKLTAIYGIYGAVMQAVEGRAPVATAHAQIDALMKALADNDIKADAALDARFPGKDR